MAVLKQAVIVPDQGPASHLAPSLEKARLLRFAKCANSLISMRKASDVSVFYRDTASGRVKNERDAKLSERL